MGKWTGLGIVFVIAALVAIVFLRAAPPDNVTGVSGEVEIADLLAASADSDFAAVSHPPEFAFPDDHVRHSEYRTEWWNVSGTLEDESGAVLGLQVMLVRIGLDSRAVVRSSRWAANEIYAGIASLSHPFESRLVTGQRLSRGALGLAGTALEPVRFWLENWRFEARDMAGAAISLDARVAIEALELELRLENTMPLIDSGDMPAQAGQRAPFQFYLQPRLRATGTIRAGSTALAVTGSMSFEHAWGELPLPGGPVARDRMTLYLDDQRVVSIVVTHRADGTGIPEAGGLLVDADGRLRVLAADDVQLAAADYWKSPRTGTRYPIGWALRIPRYDIDVELQAAREDQEGSEWTAFWAGPIRVIDAGKGAIGSGFVQLYGYDTH